MTQILAVTLIIICGIAFEFVFAQEQTDEMTQEDSVRVPQKKKPEGERGRNPFLLPPGIYLLSKRGTTSGQKEGTAKPDARPQEIDSLRVKTILISDNIRIAQIDRHIVTVGDWIHDEKVLEIKTDRVILGKGNQKRTLLLSQSPVSLTVEEKRPPSLILPRKEEGKERDKGE